MYACNSAHKTKLTSGLYSSIPPYTYLSTPLANETFYCKNPMKLAVRVLLYVKSCTSEMFTCLWNIFYECDEQFDVWTEVEEIEPLQDTGKWDDQWDDQEDCDAGHDKLAHSRNALVTPLKEW